MTRRYQKRKLGGQPGNQNARKHGLYSRVVTPQMPVRIRKAIELEGLNNEIALARAKLGEIAAHDTPTSPLLLLALDVFVRLVRTRYHLPRRARSFSPGPGAN